MYDSDELRALAEDALKAESGSSASKLRQAMTPETVLALLDEIEALRELYTAVVDHRAMYEGTSDEFNMSEQTIAEALKKIEVRTQGGAA